MIDRHSVSGSDRRPSSGLNYSTIRPAVGNPGGVRNMRDKPPHQSRVERVKQEHQRRALGKRKEHRIECYNFGVQLAAPKIAACILSQPGGVLDPEHKTKRIIATYNQHSSASAADVYENRLLKRQAAMLDCPPDRGFSEGLVAMPVFQVGAIGTHQVHRFRSSHPIAPVKFIVSGSSQMRKSTRGDLRDAAQDRTRHVQNLHGEILTLCVKF